MTASNVTTSPQENTKGGFTIVELLIVIVVIGILAAITIVAFNGVQKRAIITTLKSDLKGATTQLEVIKTSSATEVYPSSSANLKTTEGNAFEYTYTATDTSYCLTATSSKKGIPAYMVSSGNKTPREGACPGHSSQNIATAADTCFGTGGYGNPAIIAIYYDYENNDPTKPACPRDLKIPAVIRGVQITGFLNTAFQDKRLTSVVIPNYIVTLETGAFRDNLLTSVTIPNSVTTIDYGAFQANRLTSVVLPESITTIGYQAFFENKLTSVTIPGSVTLIDGNAFRRNMITSVTIPRSVSRINARAFFENPMISASVPTSTLLDTTDIFDPSVNVTRY